MIPIYQPFLNKENLKYAHKAIDSGWISSQGEYLDLSKNKLKEILNCKKIILTNNGTTATHLLAIALKYKYPHITKIIVPNNVYVAAWNSFLFDKNYELIPIDSDLNTWNFDINKIDSLIDENTAILAVHNIGNIVNIPKLKLRFPNTVILEDNCEGFLGKYEGKYTGTESFASSISFFGNKTITSGEGGAFITNDDDVFEYINKVKSQGQSNEKFIHDVLGYNYRMTNIQAAILYGQLECLDEIKEKKHKIFNRYKSIFENENKISLQVIETNTEHSEWMFGLRLNTFTLSQKKELELHLFQSGIDTRPMFYEMKKHKYISHILNKDYNSVILNEQCIILPSYPQLTNGQVNFISDKILKFINNENK
jgi:perosamine synthetase